MARSASACLGGFSNESRPTLQLCSISIFELDQLGWRSGSFSKANKEVLNPFGYGTNVNSKAEIMKASGLVTFCLIVDSGKVVQ